MQPYLSPAIVSLVVSFLLYAPSVAFCLAFPTAEGFGKDSLGGRGGRVIQVSNLNDNGPGSFRACVEETGPRTCIFTVGGTIQLQSDIIISEQNSFLTIAGQTAPGGGIAITPNSVNFMNGFHDGIIRHIRHRQAFATPPANQNAGCGGIFVFGNNNQLVYNVILDHVSIAWACDDSFQAVGAVNATTIQWSLLAEGYEGSYLGKPDGYGDSKGYIGGVTANPQATVEEVSSHHNLFAFFTARTPNISPAKLLDWRYNMMYTWYACTGNMELGITNDNSTRPDLTTNVNFVGNRYHPGPEIQDVSGFNPDCSLGTVWNTAPTFIYVQDNEVPWCGYSTCATNEWDGLGWVEEFGGTKPPPQGSHRAFSPFPAPAITPTARNALQSTLTTQTGATKPMRDSLDARIVTEINTVTGRIGRSGAPFPILANGTPPQDSDGDGIPDTWETSRGLNPNNVNDGAAMTGNGYTNLENYLNELAGDGTPVDPPQPPANNANPIYVDAGGHGATPSDSNDCIAAENINTPKATLASALACMTFPGKVLRIRGGTYAAFIDTQATPIRGGDSWSLPTFISPYFNAGSFETVTIQLPATHPGGVIFLRNGETYITFMALILDGMNRANADGVIMIGGTGHIRLANMEIKNTTFHNVSLWGSQDVQITNSNLHATSTTFPLIATHAAGVNGIVIDSNVLHTATAAGIVLNTDSGAYANVTITKNTIRNTTTGLDVGPGTGLVAQNNLLYSNGDGIHLRSTATGAKILHNTASSNTGTGILCDSGATGIEIRANLAVGNTVAQITNNCGATGGSNITTGALGSIFTNAPGGDYTLVAGSPAQNSVLPADDLPAVIDDIIGTLRPQQVIRDAGAYESLLGPVVPPATTTRVGLQSTFFY